MELHDHLGLRAWVGVHLGLWQTWGSADLPAHEDYGASQGGQGARGPPLEVTETWQVGIRDIRPPGRRSLHPEVGVPKGQKTPFVLVRGEANNKTYIWSWPDGWRDAVLHQLSQPGPAPFLYMAQVSRPGQLLSHGGQPGTRAARGARKPVGKLARRMLARRGAR